MIGAQQRKGEYSPFKGARTTRNPASCSAQQRKGEYSPFKCWLRDLLRHLLHRSTKEGGIFPLQAGSGHGPGPARRRSTKEGGIFPLQVLSSGACGRIGSRRSTKEGGIFPLQGGCIKSGCMVITRSTKEGGIFPLQALLLRYVTIRGRNGPTWPRYARTGYIREKLSMKFSRSTAGSQDSHRIHGLPVW